MPHDWIIFSPADAPAPSALLARLAAGGQTPSYDPDLAPASPDSPAWELLGLRLGPRQPAVVIEVEQAVGASAWLMGAEVERAARILGRQRACAGRREALRRLERSRTLFGVHLIPAPAAGSPAWRDAAAVAAALAEGPGALAWQPGGEFWLEGRGIEVWSGPPA